MSDSEYLLPVSSKMNPEVKVKWLAALRSEGYLQGKDCLRGLDGKFCCLGVLTDIYLKEHGFEWEKPDGYNTFSYHVGFEAEVLSSVVQEWSGLKIPSGGTFMYQGLCHSLPGLNDGGVPFYELADIIEKEF